MFTMTMSDTGTKIEAEKYVQNPMGICVGICLCRMNTSTQFYASHFTSICIDLGVWQCEDTATEFIFVNNQV